MKKFRVTLKCFHESFGGHDQFDGEVKHIVEACNVKSAEKKAISKEINPGKGMRWSQSRWVKVVGIRDITSK